MTLGMTDWWSSLGTMEQIFWGIAIVSSVLFVIQFGLSLLGLDFEGEVDADGPDADFSIDPSFTILSIRSAIAFLTFFGWAGVLTLHGGGSTVMVFVWAIISGLAAMVLVAYLMYFFSSLTEVGNADINDLLFQNGKVYLTIPGHRKGMGKVHVTLGNALREMNGVTEGEQLASGKAVKIVEILEKNILVVEPIEIFETTIT